MWDAEFEAYSPPNAPRRASALNLRGERPPLPVFFTDNLDYEPPYFSELEDRVYSLDERIDRLLGKIEQARTLLQEGDSPPLRVQDSFPNSHQLRSILNWQLPDGNGCCKFCQSHVV